MRQFNIPINGSLFCIEEVQLTSLTVLGLTVEECMKFTGFPKWEVNSLSASARGKLGAANCLQLAYKAQEFEFTRSGLFRGKPVFTVREQRILLQIAPWVKLE